MTAARMLWTVSSRFFADKTPRFKHLTRALAALGTVLPCARMVNLVYVINSYVGILLLVLMLVKTGTRLMRRQRSLRHIPTAPTRCRRDVHDIELPSHEISFRGLFGGQRMPRGVEGPSSTLHELETCPGCR